MCIFIYNPEACLHVPEKIPRYLPCVRARLACVWQWPGPHGAAGRTRVWVSTEMCYAIVTGVWCDMAGDASRADIEGATRVSFYSTGTGHTSLSLTSNPS